MFMKFSFWFFWLLEETLSSIYSKSNFIISKLSFFFSGLFLTFVLSSFLSNLVSIFLESLFFYLRLFRSFLIDKTAHLSRSLFSFWLFVFDLFIDSSAESAVFEPNENWLLLVLSILCYLRASFCVLDYTVSFGNSILEWVWFSLLVLSFWSSIYTFGDFGVVFFSYWSL